MPPQHGKSELVSHWTAVWFMKKFPWKKVGLASYEMQYVAEWGGKAKDTIVDNPDELGLQLRSDTKAKGRWNLRGYGGGMFTAGIGGPFTGRGFDLIIIDCFGASANTALWLNNFQPRTLYQSGHARHRFNLARPFTNATVNLRGSAFAGEGAT